MSRLRCLPWSAPWFVTSAAADRPRAGVTLLVAGGTLVAGGGWPRGQDLAVGVVAAAGVGMVVVRPGAGLDAVGVVAAVGANLSFAAGVVLTLRFPPAGDRLAATGRQLLAGGSCSSRSTWGSRALPRSRPPAASSGSRISAWPPPPWPSSCGSTAFAGCRRWRRRSSAWRPRSRERPSAGSPWASHYDGPAGRVRRHPRGHRPRVDPRCVRSSRTPAGLRVGPGPSSS